MRIHLLCKNEVKNQIVFELFDLETPNRELIVINDNEDPIKAFKNGLLADTLFMMAADERNTTREEVYRIIDSIKNTKIRWF